MKRVILILMMFLSIISCNKYTFDDTEAVKTNSEQVFGVSFPSSQDWNMTTNGSITVNSSEFEDIVKIQILASFSEDSTTSLRILNEAEGGTITFDVPNNYKNLYAAFINSNGQYFYKKFNLDGNVSTRAVTRGFGDGYNLPNVNLVINGTVESFANQRGWLPGEVFYTTNIQSISVGDYSSDFKAMFDDIIFNYFPNGRKYNNLPQIKKSGYYNESSYPITTGDKPIIVSPVYKNDGGYYEISEADLYYYYFKGDPSVSEIEALPKYKAIQLNDVYSNSDNQVIAKTKSYALVYWGDETPQVGVTTGSYQFPEGYKIGFMYHSKTEYEKPKKQGELYGDGRLNYNINNWGNFKSSKLGSTEPRMAWMSINDKMFLCIESGTDTDFNDLICEVEGGIKPIIVIPDPPEYQFYTFCYEDQRLGDYDMNDVVLKGNRIDETHVEWTLMATGATDELYIYNVEGTNINKNVEVHDIFNRPKGTFVNTSKNDHTPFVKDIVVVDKNFSFLNTSTQPYIFDKTRNWEVKIARRGEDPHAIMIPYDFRWPLEKICIKNAYLDFNNWGTKLIEETDWFKYPIENLVY